MATVTRKIAYNTITQLISKAITTVLSVVMLGALARYLGVAGYGSYSTALAFVGFLAILADMGLYTIAVREISRGDRDESFILGNIFTLRVFLALLFLIVTPLIGLLIPVYSPEIKVGILVTAFGSFFILIDQIFVGVFQAHLKMHLRAWTELATRIILLAVVLVGIWLQLPLVYFFAAHVFGTLLQALLSYLFSRHIVRFGLRFDFPYWQETVREALPLGIVIALGMVYFRVDSVMLSLMDSSVAVGVYSAPYKVLEVLILFPAIFMNSVFPVISRYIYDHDQRFSDSFQKSFDFMSIFAFPIFIGVLVTAPAIIHLVVGPEFSASGDVLRILIAAVFIIFYGTIFGNFIVAAGDQKKLVPMYLVGALLNVALNFLLIPAYSYIGAAIATVITEMCVSLGAFAYIMRYYRFSLRLGIFIKTAVAAAIMGIVLYWLQSVHLFLLITIAMAIYSVMVFAFRVVTKDHLRRVFSRL